jgi:hypothetical protein
MDFAMKYIKGVQKTDHSIRGDHMIHVVHNETFLRYSFLSDEKIKALFESQKVEDFLMVAAVKSDNLDDAFRSTNNIDTNWCENSNVIAFQKECRSSSVGDLFIADTGKWYIVATCGFVEVPADVKFFKEVCKTAYPAARIAFA